MERANLDFQDLQQGSEEHKFIRDLITALKLSQVDRAHLNAIARSRDGRFSLAVWEEAFPDFPVIFRIRNVLKRKEYGKLSTFFTTGQAKRETKIFEDLLESEDLGYLPLALVSRFPYFNDWMVLHNLLIEEYKRPTMVIPSLKNPGVLYHLETLTAFADRVRMEDAIDDSGFVL